MNCPCCNSHELNRDGFDPTILVCKDCGKEFDPTDYYDTGESKLISVPFKLIEDTLDAFNRVNKGRGVYWKEFNNKMIELRKLID